MKNRCLGRTKEKKIEFLILAIVYGYIFFTMFYADLTVTLQFSMTYIDSLFDGKFASFYNNALATGIAPEGAVYDVGIYFVFAVWGLPVYILNKLFQVSYLSVGSMLWFKLMLVLFVFFTKCIMEKIAEEIGLDTVNVGKWCLVSPLIIFPSMVVAQYDIIPVFFMLIGVWYGIRDEKLKCTLFFAISFIMKPISLFAFVVVLLIKEKKIINVIKYGLLSVVPLFICKLIYIINPVNNPTNNSFMTKNLLGVFEVSVNMGNEKMSLFAFLFFVVCAYCFMYEPNGNKEIDGRWLIWSLYAVWLAFCIFTSVIPYWIIYMAPFIIFVSFFCDDRINRILIMETIASSGFVLFLSYKYTWVYGGSKTYSYLLFKDFFSNKQKVHTVAGVLRSLGIENFITVIYAVIVGAFLVILYKGYLKLKCEDRKIKTEKISVWQWWTKLLFLYAWCLLTLLIFIVSK